MSAHTKPQIITGDDGLPAFAVVPYQDYLALINGDEGVTLPSEVVELHAIKGYSLLKSWRIHRGINQSEMAKALGTSQSNVSQTEAVDNAPSKETLKTWASVLKCDYKQLDS
ncbi:helix-turn-helix domain-containing protein [Bermanella sp. R86510]|uniref:helix-turn-helix domain-containing protein n=1 Tax=unclassified Bermanella TaxID=2627862 RepID=UPI0037CA4562